MADVLGVSADSGEAKTLPAIPSDDLVDSSSLGRFALAILGRLTLTVK